MKEREINSYLYFFSQELYEPIWDDILDQASAHGFRIRSIWMADMAWQGESGLVNKGKLGNDRMLFSSSLVCHGYKQI